jgi:hypothetical protein
MFTAMLVVAILSAVWARYVLGPAPLDIHNTRWIWGDLAQVYVAWGQFLGDSHSHWLSTNRLSYPLRMSISLFDPMPLFLLMAKPFSQWLPGGGQLIGWYFVSCLVLQGIFGFLAARQICRLLDMNATWPTLYVGMLGAMFMATMPFTFFRFQFHTALSSQWVLVLSLWSCLSTLGANRAKWVSVNCIVLLLATGINPYLATLVLISLAIVCVVDASRLGGREVLLRCLSLVVTGAMGFYVFGFMSGTGVQGEGYGLFSMNALGPIDPKGLGRINKLHVADPTGYQFLEGFDYMGLGAFVLSLFPLTLLFKKPASATNFPFLAAFLVIVVCYGLSLSTDLTLDSHRLHLELPVFVESALSRFRASGRLFWMAGFWLVLAGYAACIIRFGIKRSTVLLSILFFLQLSDIQSIAYATKIAISKGVSEELKGVPPGRYRAIFVYPPWECDHQSPPLGPRNFESVGLFALQNNLPTNNFYAARNPSHQLQFHCNVASITNEIDPEAIYLFSNVIFPTVKSRLGDRFDCSRNNTSDGSWLCVPRKPISR